MFGHTFPQDTTLINPTSTQAALNTRTGYCSHEASVVASFSQFKIFRKTFEFLLAFLHQVSSVPERRTGNVRYIFTWAAGCSVTNGERFVPHRASSPHQPATAPETLSCLTETMMRTRSSAVVASPLKCIDVFPPPLLFRGPRDKGLVPRKTGLAQGPFG